MTRDMTVGNSAKTILFFTLPLLIGQVFQQLYSMVDSIIVGKYVGTQAFAAVGSTGSITFFVLGLVFGSCSGFAIPVAQDFGAGDYNGVRRCVANIIYISAAITVIVTAVTCVFCGQILHLLDTQEGMFKDAYDYLFWIFLGTGAQLMYNMLSGILRSLGDSRTPLYFLILASVLNIILDLLLVKAAGIGVKGAAIATVVSQLVSALLCLFYMIKHYPLLRLSKKDLRVHWRTINRLLGIGLPMGLQFSITAIGSIMLQKSVNGLSAASVTAVTAGNKVNMLVCSPMDAFGVTVATYTGQNYGARKMDRIRKGMRELLLMYFGCALIRFILMFFFGKTLALLFMDASETEILNLAAKYMNTLAIYGPALMMIYLLRNALQGVGFSKVAMLAGVFEMVARVGMSLFVIPNTGFDGVCITHPIAWFAADLILFPLYYIFMIKKLGRESMTWGNAQR